MRQGKRRLALVVVVVAGLGPLVSTWRAPAERPAELAAQRSAAKPAQKEPELAAEPVGGASKGPGGLPITGKALAVFAPLDVAVEKILLRHGIPGASLAITKDGKLVYAKGYGWGHYEAKTLATAETLFGLASVSKCFTAMAILKLVEEGKLRLDQKAFDVLKHLKPPPGAVADPRLFRITIRQLLNHSAGWDSSRSGDPINWAWQVSQRLRVPMPINEDHLIRFVMGTRLDFDPGTKAQYSNFGYIVLGQIVARVSGQSYEQYVRAKVLKPMGITGARLHDREGTYFRGEGAYNPGLPRTMSPYCLPWTDASGGWTASAVDLARFLTAVDGSPTGKPFLSADLMKEMVAPPPAPLRPRADGTHFGLGWDVVQKLPRGHGYLKTGCWPGVRSSVKHRVDGVNAIVLYNAIVQLDPVDMRAANDAVAEVQEAVAGIKVWPKIDLFAEHR